MLFWMELRTTNTSKPATERTMSATRVAGFTMQRVRSDHNQLHLAATEMAVQYAACSRDRWGQRDRLLEHLPHQEHPGILFSSCDAPGGPGAQEIRASHAKRRALQSEGNNRGRGLLLGDKSQYGCLDGRGAVFSPRLGTTRRISSASERYGLSRSDLLRRAGSG